jgi:hypothetical protein
MFIISFCSYSQDDSRYSSYDTTFTFKVNGSTTLYEFHVTSESEPDKNDSSLAYQTYNFVITKNNSLDTLQVIEDRTEVTVLPGAFDDVFTSEDVNFDGFMDFRYLYDSGANGNPRYHYWIYDVKTKQFIREPVLDDLTYPSPNYITKQIEDYQKCGGGCQTRASYIFKDHKLIMVKCISTDYDSEKNGSVYIKYTYSKLLNGKMKIMRKSVIPDSELDDLEKEDWGSK